MGDEDDVLLAKEGSVADIAEPIESAVDIHRALDLVSSFATNVLRSAEKFSPHRRILRPDSPRSNGEYDAGRSAMGELNRSLEQSGRYETMTMDGRRGVPPPGIPLNYWQHKGTRYR